MSRLQGINPKKVDIRFLEEGKHAVKCVAVVQATVSKKSTNLESIDETHIEDLVSVHFPNVMQKIRKGLLDSGKSKQHITRWTLEVVNE